VSSLELYAIELMGFRGCSGEPMPSSVLRRSGTAADLGELPRRIGAADAVMGFLSVNVGGVRAGAAGGT
jgi:hypothetical protein